MAEDALRKTLKEVFDGHRWIDFDWDGWRERARRALAAPPAATWDAEVFVRGLLVMADKAADDGDHDTATVLRALAAHEPVSKGPDQ